MADARRYGEDFRISQIEGGILTDAICSGTMLKCGIHPCPLKCHQIEDHSQMPCQHPYSGMCVADRHMLKWKCHQSMPDPCPVCKKEAERAEQQKKRELELKQRLEEEEQKRLMQRAEEQLEHDLRMAELDAKLKLE